MLRESKIGDWEDNVVGHGYIARTEREFDTDNDASTQLSHTLDASLIQSSH